MDSGMQQGFAMAAIGFAGTVAGLFFGWLKDRDKLQYDRRLGELQTQNTTQATQIASLATTQAECEQKHRECEEKHQTTEVQIKDIQTAIAQMKK